MKRELVMVPADAQLPPPPRPTDDAPGAFHVDSLHDPVSRPSYSGKTGEHDSV